MIPVRCLSCGKVVSAYFDEFQQRTNDGEDPKAVLDDIGVDRYCCRRMLIAHVEVW
jgi:DNA-directed RNA polymerase subunit N